jgi:pyruvate dehydrogenase E2 component (dihydrolipoamide acetyltransferase)
MGEFRMPSLGADMERGTLSEWLVAVGDEVRKGQIVAVIETDKSDVEVEVFESGRVSELLVEAGTEVEVGTPLARIGTAGEAAGTGPEPAAAPEPVPDVPPAEVPSAEVPPARIATVSGGGRRGHASAILSPILRQLAGTLHVDPESVAGTGPGGRLTRADIEAAAVASTVPAAATPVPRDVGGAGSSPFARRQAAERGIDLSTVAGSGPGGAVRARDLPERAAEPVGAESAQILRPGIETAEPPEPPSAGRGGRDRSAAMRQAIARLMTTANRDIPHYHVLSTLDVHDGLTWLDRHNASHPPAERILPAAVLLRATAVAAAQVPELNGWWQDDTFVPATSVDLGVAVSLRGGGVVTPTIAGADQLSLLDTMAALRGLVARARRGNLRSADLATASLTVTNLGEQGAEEVIGVIHPPQVAIVGFGRPVDRVLAVDGMVAVRPTIRATVSGDHRATDGHAGSLLLAAIAKALEHPDAL